MEPEEQRAREGVFLAFQYPVEIPGVNSTYFEAAYNEFSTTAEAEMDAVEFLSLVRRREDEDSRAGSEALNRPMNEGFSGGEKKRNEIFRWLCWSQKAGLWIWRNGFGADIDALKIGPFVGRRNNKLRRKDEARNW